MIPAYDSRMKEKSEKNWEKLAKMSIYRYISDISTIITKGTSAWNKHACHWGLFFIFTYISVIIDDISIIIGDISVII